MPRVFFCVGCCAWRLAVGGWRSRSSVCLLLLLLFFFVFFFFALSFLLFFFVFLLLEGPCKLGAQKPHVSAFLSVPVPMHGMCVYQSDLVVHVWHGIVSCVVCFCVLFGVCYLLHVDVDSFGGVCCGMWMVFVCVVAVVVVVVVFLGCMLLMVGALLWCGGWLWFACRR